MTNSWASIGVLLLFGSTPAGAQTAASIELDSLKTRFARGFTRIGGLRELPDGSILVLDVEDRTVQHINKTWTESIQVGRHGAGPREYYEPIALFAWSGDSTLILDQRLKRLLVVSPQGEAVEVRNAFGMAGRLTWACETCWYSSTGIMLMEAEAVDAQGRFYAKAGPIVRTRDGLRLADSAAVERWTLGSTSRDTVAFVATELTDQHRIIVGSAVHVNPIRRAFESRPEWAVSPDGWVAIVSVDPYRVSLVGSDGTHIDGEPLAYDRVRVDDRLKDAWREWQQRSVPVTYVSATGESSVSVERRRPVEPEWPRNLPPFLPGAVRFGPGGNVWINRAVAVGARPIVDVVDRRGTRVAQLLLPAARRLVGFGDAAVYAAHIDESDLEYLERYAMLRLPAQQ